MNKGPIKPPELAQYLLSRVCNNAFVEDVEGDIDELFLLDVHRGSLFRAQLNYWKHVLTFAFSYALKQRKNKATKLTRSFSSLHPNMIQSYFTIAWRIVNKNRLYSIINVFGLTLGICACLTIYLIVDHEFSFDTFQKDKERIYRLVHEGEKHHEWRSNSVPAPLAPAIREELTGFEVVTGFHHIDANVTIIDNGVSHPFNRSASKIIIAEPEYFSIFKYTWLFGDSTVLSKPFQLVLTEKQAQTYFGKISLDKLIGREVIYTDSLRMTVAGIVKDHDLNTDFSVTDFISFPTINVSFLNDDVMLNEWQRNMHSSQAYVKLQRGATPQRVSRAFTTLLRKHTPGDAGDNAMAINMQPLEEIHFNINYNENPTLLSTLYTLSGLALFILLIAAINFVNLSTAQAARRSKEIGIRKVMGSYRTGLRIQFLTETFALTAFAVLMAALLVTPIISAFDNFIPNGVVFHPFSLPNVIFLIGITLGTTLLAGFYPAKVLSSYLPSLSLKGVIQHSGSSTWLLRKGLIVFQFSISLFFIIGALVMGHQIRYIRAADKGFSTASVVTFRGQWNDPTGKLFSLSKRVKQIKGVEGVTMQIAAPMAFAQWFNVIKYKGAHPLDTAVSIRSASSDYIPLYQIHLLAGRNIRESDSLKEFVINRAYAKELGFTKFDEAVGEILYMDDRPYPIVGVVENFHIGTFHESIGPSVIGNIPQFHKSIGLKISDADMKFDKGYSVMKEVGKKYKETFPDEAFEYHFIDQEIEWMHESESKAAYIMNLAMFITIFISAMGVFGLVMFTAETKTKEIAIRKVLGATVSNIASMLSREFAQLIVIAILLSSPFAWYYLSEWLSKFTYHVDLDGWAFLIAGGMAMLIGVLTIGFHTMKSAMANPAKSLRSE